MCVLLMNSRPNVPTRNSTSRNPKLAAKTTAAQKVLQSLIANPTSTLTGINMCWCAVARANRAPNNVSKQVLFTRFKLPRLDLGIRLTAKSMKALLVVQILHQWHQ